MTEQEHRELITVLRSLALGELGINGRAARLQAVDQLEATWSRRDENTSRDENTNQPKEVCTFCSACSQSVIVTRAGKNVSRRIVICPACVKELRVKRYQLCGACGSTPGWITIGSFNLCANCVLVYLNISEGTE